MSDQEKKLLFEIIKSLRVKVTRTSTFSDLEKVFLAWLFPKNCPIEIDLHEIFKRSEEASGASRSYREVATLGFLSAIDNKRYLSKSLEKGLSWLAGRQAFPENGTPSFEVHGVALLGFALGNTFLDDANRKKTIEWMSSFLPKSAYAKLDHFNRAMLAASSEVVGMKPKVSFEENSISSCVKLICSQKGLIEASKHVSNIVLIELLSNIDENDPTIAALYLAALDTVIYSSPNINFIHLAINDLISVLEGIPHALKRWTWEQSHRTGRSDTNPIKWQIENEYHLQNLLWLILAPIFKDLIEEENIKSSGPVHPRADLCIPSLKVVVEAKFMRTGAQSEQSKLLNELAADAIYYCVPSSGYTKIIPVIWDDSRKTEHHQKMLQGINSIPNVEKAFIISRPGSMELASRKTNILRKDPKKKVFRKTKTTKK